MFVLLLKAVPPNRRIQALICFLAGLFVVSLFLVDLDSEEGHAPGSNASLGAPEVASGGRSTTAAVSESSPSPYNYGKGKIATGYKYKIFVYEEDLPMDLYGALLRDVHCRNDYNGAEALLPSVLKSLDVYTPFGDLADYYVVPVMTECFLNKKLLAGRDFNWALKDLNALFESTLDEIQSSHPHWSRTEGRDHIFVFPSERGPQLLNEANLQRIRKSIFVTGLTSYKPSVFEPWKDIVVPAWRKLDSNSSAAASA